MRIKIIWKNGQAKIFTKCLMIGSPKTRTYDIMTLVTDFAALPREKNHSIVSGYMPMTRKTGEYVIIVSA